MRTKILMEWLDTEDKTNVIIFDNDTKKSYNINLETLKTTYVNKEDDIYDTIEPNGITFVAEDEHRFIRDDFNRYDETFRNCYFWYLDSLRGSKAL